MAQAKKALAKKARKSAGRAANRSRTKTYQNYIEGRWVPSASGEWLENINPADTRDVVGRFPRSNEEDVDRASLLHALSDFLKANDLKADWEGIENAPNEALVNALAMMSPYGTAEKQALLEAPDLKTRAEILVAATEIELAKKTSGGETSLQ